MQTGHPKWACPHCGEVPEDGITLYREDLRIQNFTVYPILPVCRSCGAEIVFYPEQAGDGGSIIVLSGTCGSGKTSVGEQLMRRHGFCLIDSDCVVGTIRHRTGVKKVDMFGDDFLRETAYKIDILRLLGRDIVFSHVIFPGDM